MIKKVVGLFAIFVGYSGLQGQNFTKDDYTKTETYIKTRDGVALYTAIYQPKDNAGKYPIMMTRTPYGAAPYGKDMPDELMYNDLLVKSGYIFVVQDIRGRSMSDGEDMINLKPVYSQKDPSKTDEVTDTYDTFQWLLKNVKNNNGKIGIYGNSYRGWTSLMGALTKHPALKVAIVGSPSIDTYFEDFSRYGLFSLAYAPIMDWFGTPKKGRKEGPWWDRNLGYYSEYKAYNKKLDKDNYDFFLKKGALSNYNDFFSKNNYFWEYLRDHPNYDQQRQERNTLQYIKDVNCPVLVVGGWNDEQNLYGLVNSYKTISKNNKKETKFIAGPWSHGDYQSPDDLYYVGNIYYGKNFHQNYTQKEFEFVEHYLKNKEGGELPNISTFDLGKKEWSFYKEYPQTQKGELYLMPEEKLSFTSTAAPKAASYEYVSDPAKPVPYIEDDNFNLFVAKSSMTDDQRFASKRPDVLSFSTDELTEDITMMGSLDALLKFSTNHTDADLIVKLIDVYPMDRWPEETDKPNVKMNGYQGLVRTGYIRGKFRESFTSPKPFVPNAITDVNVPLLDVHYTFKKGHKIMIQIQSSLFPLFDRNPQVYMDNIFKAEDKDFVQSNHKIYSGSRITFNKLEQ
ncbi:CocE/NonD family hydrolase [Chryseobacterium indologenes]|uniref:CocE/NonD family hydrolase n=1 Tax=Chryseobacterium indologenes TaxID=253 RepID=UPI002578ADE5|nr:CocE/NonD family hydrolase [Chryseobacterium indologenes]MDM1553029.1 CocE/NonD family hydrolase [Chryseobacterium indologenes]